MSKHRLTVLVDVDDERLERVRRDLDRRGQLDLAPGTPDVWSGLHDIADAFSDGIIRDGEIVDYEAVS